MSDKQYHKLLFWFIMAVVMMGIVIVLLVCILNKPKDVQINNYVGQKGDSGLNGKDGYTPVKGVDYFDGVDSISTVVEKFTVETIVEKQIIEVPVKGEKGDVGSPALQIHIDVNEHCQVVTWYDGDDLKQVIAQLPKPCEVSNE